MQPTTRTLHRHQKTVLQCLAGVLVFGLFLRFWTGNKDHYLSTDLVHYNPGPDAGDEVRLADDEASSICKSHGFSTFRKDRKVYDLILFNTELDWLEIRLQTLSPYVDYFIVVESPTTFTSKSKPLHLQENWDRFNDFHHKIVHRIVHDPTESDRIWDHEDWFRNSMLTDVFPGLVGTQHEAHHGDALIVSDVDEIVRPGAMLLLRHCDFPARLTLRSDFYYYSFQWRHKGPQWAHPDATIYRGPDTILPNDLRAGLLDDGWAPFAAFRRWRARATLWNAGWHCSSCFATVEEMRNKMQSFSHQGWNTAGNRNASVMMDRVRNGKDLFGRKGEVYERIDDNQDVPEFILEQNRAMMRFRYMLTRDGESAGFDDWDTVTNDDQRR